ncbi:MAG: hypothetical protein B1H07_00620 [Campylobacteraceae bacterium 4484_166]|nr:MAG: hypothetical protein B1H07_00620 [Campylobacteraceae bacterium 4484_166]
MQNIILSLLVLFFITGCASKQANTSKPAIVIFKTKKLNFYDQGFVTHFDNYTKLQVYSMGQSVLELDVSPKKVCSPMFSCIKSQTFNNKFLHHSYEDDFLYKLLNKKRIHHKDKKNKIFIKVKYVK